MRCTSAKCINYLPWFPSLSLCLRCAMSDYMVVAMQRRCDKYIVPALNFNIIIVATAAHSIAMLYQGVAVAVFPTYMGVYVAYVCVLNNTRACRSSSIKRVNSCSGPCPSAPVDQATPSPSPRSPCCAWRRPDCRRKNLELFQSLLSQAEGWVLS